nr:type II toxin-antitoxin system VapC family toxin [uncultured Shinella sp.]
MYLLDTNVVSELRKTSSGRVDANVLRWSQSVPPALCHVSAISILELEIGVRQMERGDVRQAEPLRRWLDGTVLPFFRDRILPVDLAVVLRLAEMSVPNRPPERDGLIGATAYVHNMVLVTRNVADFEGAGLRILNPWLDP